MDLNTKQMSKLKEPYYIQIERGFWVQVPPDKSEQQIREKYENYLKTRIARSAGLFYFDYDIFYY